MITLIGGSLVLSILHALIPNHWLPILAIGKKEGWSITQTTKITILSGLAHALSTVLIGFLVGFIGVSLSDQPYFSNFITPGILILLGVFYIYQHHHHKHFHLHGTNQGSSNYKVVAGLVIAMFFSPCFEIEAYFLMAGSHGGWQEMMLLAVLYTVVTVSGMTLWVRIAYKGIVKLNWHTLEHNAGIITGWTLIATGLVSFAFS